MNIINTKYGSFEVVDNGNGGASLYINDVKICEFPKVAWWNVDAIEKGLEEHKELIQKRIEERVKEVNVTRENAVEVISQIMEVMKDETKGFYASRLRQCLNKLLAA